MKALLLMLGSALLLTGTTHAQTTFRFGPQVSIVRSTSHSTLPDLSGRTGVEAGLVGVLQVGHFAFQPAVLYSQRGFRQQELLVGSSSGGARTTTRLDYLRIPLQFAYAQRTAGQGFQMFAGPYLGVLLGGRNKLSYGSSQETGRVTVTNEHTSSISPYAVSVPDYNYYARRLDLGAQAGLGYQLGGALLQLSYSQGLRNMKATELYTIGSLTYDSDTPDCRNRSWQASLSYLFGSKG
jgi:hypothetical protein